MPRIEERLNRPVSQDRIDNIMSEVSDVIEDPTTLGAEFEQVTISIIEDRLDADRLFVTTAPVEYDYSYTDWVFTYPNGDRLVYNRDNEGRFGQFQTPRYQSGMFAVTKLGLYDQGNPRVVVIEVNRAYSIRTRL